MISEQTRNKLTTIAENEQKVYDNGVADGKRAEYDAFWDDLQWGGKRKNYARGFGYWGNKEIIPKRKIVPSRAELLFNHCENLKIINKELFDLSQANYSPTDTDSATYAICDSCFSLEVFPDIGLQAGYYGYAFSECKSLHTIEVIRVNEDTLFGPSAFRIATNLINLEIEGVIGKDFLIKDSPLSPASLKSIVKHLKSYLGTSSEYAYTLTVKTSAWEALVSAGCTDEDFAWIEETFGISKSLWEEFGFTWTDIVGYLRWNLVLA